MVVSCQTNEDKAADLIKAELTKTLPDMKTYEPLETTVAPAKLNMYNDSVTRGKALAFGYRLKEMYRYNDIATNAQEKMTVWGVPSYRTSAHSDSMYYKYKKELEESDDKRKAALTACMELSDDLKRTVAAIDTSRVLGWEANHRFRYQKEGKPVTAHYRYILSQDFKRVLMCEDMTNAETQMIRRYINVTDVPPDGTLVKPDGTLNPVGTLLRADGTKVMPEGTLVRPDGTQVKPDGTIINPDGSVVPATQAAEMAEEAEEANEMEY